MFQKYISQQYRRPSGIVGRWIGQKMAEQHRPENLWTVRLLDVQPNDKLLEIGFGPGFAVQQVAQSLTNGLIAGIDFSQTMVSTATRRNTKAVQEGRADLRYGDVTALPFADNFFDKAFSINSIYFWTDLPAALLELWRVIKPGGTLILTFLPLERWNSEKYGTPTPTPEFQPYASEQIKKALITAGFTHSMIKADSDLEKGSSYSVIGRK